MFSDLRYAFRSLAKSPRFAFVALLALAIGVGANTAMFSVVYNVLLRPLAYPHPEKLVFIQESSNRRGGEFPTAPATYADWRDQQTVFQSMAAAEVQSMEQVVSRAVWQPRFSTTVLGGFAALALALAAIGIYGVISYGVSQRQREIGIRMALGAQPGDVQRNVLGESAKLAAAGSAIGIGGALLLTRYLQTLLYQVSATDPAVIALAACALACVALAAAWLPARRATLVDPAAALRGE